MGQIITFPARNAGRSAALCLVEVVQACQHEDSVWHAGGSLHAKYGAHVRDLPVEDALARRDFWAREAASLGHDPTQPEARLAARRYMQFTIALDALADWNRALGKRSPYPDPAGEARARLSLAATTTPEPTPPSAA